MPKTVSELPAASPADRNAVVAADNAAATLTEKVTLGQIADLAGYHLSATTTNATPTKLTGDSLALENGEAWQFEVKLVAQNKKTSGTKVWSIRGGIKRSFAGAVTIVGSLDTQTTGSIGGGSVSLTADAATQGLAITVTGLATASVDWQATVLTSERTSTQQSQVGGCTDPDVGNYDSAADYDDGSCSYSAVPSSAALEPIASEDEIETLEVTVGESVLYPAFDAGIHDYCVSTSAAYLGSVSYSVTINDGEPIEGTAKAGRTLQINDGTNYYYVRLLPSDVVVGSVEFGPTEDYVPGYYLAAQDIWEDFGRYYYVYDHRGVPLWYGKGVATRPAGAFVGRDANRLMLNSDSGQAVIAARINAGSVSRATRNMLVSPTYGTISRDSHESQEISAPSARVGNVLLVAYSQGFYLQEQSSSGELVWEWHSKEYFTSQDPEYYHINSADVHPVTGNILVSLRNCSAVLCIDYATKNVTWVMQGNSYAAGTLQSQAISAATADTKWLTIAGEPTLDGYEYSGTGSQHDARWQYGIAPITAGNDVISIYDNQTSWYTGHAPRSRGVIYEIGSVAGTALHRSSVFSDTGTSPYVGSYTVVSDGGKLSHAINFSTEQPPLVEYVGGVDSEKTKVFAMDLASTVYRIIKAPAAHFRLDNLRATCGVNIDTGQLPAEGGGGSAEGTALLLHFDGENASTVVTDSSPNALAVTAYGDVAISTAQSKFGGASLAGIGGTTSGLLIQPDAESEYAELLLDGDFTIEFWVRFNVLEGMDSLVMSRWPTGGGLTVWRHMDYADKITVWSDAFSANGAFLETTSSVVAEQWHYVTVQRSGDMFSLWLDGVKEAEATETLSITAPICCVAAYADTSFGFNYSLNGYIDELRIVKGAAVYTADFTPPSAPFTS